jgi:hypothetical protein
VNRRAAPQAALPPTRNTSNEVEHALGGMSLLVPARMSCGRDARRVRNRSHSGQPPLPSMFFSLSPTGPLLPLAGEVLELFRSRPCGQAVGRARLSNSRRAERLDIYGRKGYLGGIWKEATTRMGEVALSCFASESAASNDPDRYCEQTGDGPVPPVVVQLADAFLRLSQVDWSGDPHAGLFDPLVRGTNRPGGSYSADPRTKYGLDTE